MRRAARRGDDEGTAILEFVFLAVLLLIPLVYLMITAFTLQRAAFAVSAAAREGGRAFVTADSPAQAQARAQEAADLALQDHLGSGTTAQVTYPSCEGCADGQELAPGAPVRIAVTYDVPLPVLGGLFRGLLSSDGGCVCIKTTSTFRATVDCFREGGGDRTRCLG